MYGEYKVRKNGNSLIITVPKQAGFVENQKLRVVKEEDGSLNYEPIEDNPWFSGKFDNIDFEEMKDAMDIPMDGGTPIGKENI